MALYVDENIKKTKRIFPDQGRYDFLRYDMNENPNGLPEEFVVDVLKEITPQFLAIYPEPSRFLEKYADYIGFPKDCVTATNGSDQAIRYILQTFCRKNHEVVTVSPSFEMYWVNCNLLGLRHVPVPYNDDLSFNMQMLLDAIGPKTDVVVLLNPNNPIGDAFSRSDVVRVVEKAMQNDAIVVIDEAYHYFYRETFLDLVNQYENVIILRTFSKLFSLAACRLGVVIASETLIGYLNNLKLTFDVNAIALLFAERILDQPKIIDQLIIDESEGKAWLTKELSSSGYEVRPCEGNFIFIKTQNPTGEVVEGLKEAGILVKVWNSGILKGYIRVSTGSQNMMEKFAEVFLRIDRIQLGESS